MRACLKIILVLICSSVFAKDAETNDGVWIDGSSFYKSVKHKKKSTIYFDNWSAYVNQFLKDEDYYVALQLNEDFDPLPDDAITLPSLSTIAAIGDDELRADYFQFLESLGRTYGIHHLVLPDTTGFSVLEKEVIRQAHDYSPFYFLNRSFLSYSIPDSKKVFENKIEDKPTIWIVAQDDNMSKLNRWSNKMVTDEVAKFYDKLNDSKSADFIPAYELPHSLAGSIFSSSVIAIDANSIFPLKDQVVTYLGVDPKLKSRLGQYVQVLDYRVSGITCLVDLRDPSTKLQEGDIAIQRGTKKVKESALILPEMEVPNEELLIAKMLFGAHEITGRSTYQGARQIQDHKFLGYSDPANEGLDINHFAWIDSLAADAIRKFATPGIQLAVVKNGSVIAEKTYGFYTYDSLRPVTKSTVYDIASLTKVIATLPAIALLVDQGKISLDDSLSIHLNEFRKSNKSSITIRQLLAHNAGLLSYVPFWSMMMDGDRLDPFYYKNREDEAQDIRTYGLEPHPGMADSLKSFIVRSKLIKNPGEYNYSDLGFMILHLLVEKVSGQPFEEFLSTNFYQPMGLTSTAFNPIRNGISPTNIAPTEYDQRYRNYQVWGEVQDRNASVFGGVAGHAGLFSTATDLARMMSMFMNNGYYGGRQYLSKTTLDQFNLRYFENNRRGLGWDKKDWTKDSASSLASDESYGHTGFTGTMVWADPKADLIYVFLSNRVYPDADNWKLGELNTRTHIHDVIYQSFESSEWRN